MEQFGEADLELATRFYQSVDNTSARAVLDYLIDHPDERIEGWAIAEALSFADHRLVACATYAYGEAARSLGRARPWSEGQLGYMLPADRAALLDKARQYSTTAR